MLNQTATLSRRVDPDKHSWDPVLSLGHGIQSFCNNAVLERRHGPSGVRHGSCMLCCHTWLSPERMIHTLGRSLCVALAAVFRSSRANSSLGGGEDPLSTFVPLIIPLLARNLDWVTHTHPPVLITFAITVLITTRPARYCSTSTEDAPLEYIDDGKL